MIMATGCLSAARVPDFKGLGSFKGKTYHTGAWPHEGVDFTGMRVGIIGTGSSAIQAIPVIGEQAADLTVFQRTPNFSIPSRNGPLPDSYERQWKDKYAQLRAEARDTRNGIIAYPNDFSASPSPRGTPPHLRRALGLRWHHLHGRLQRPDLQSGGERHRRRVRPRQNPGNRQRPRHGRSPGAKGPPDRTKRICVDTRYFETYNRPNVHLVDVRRAPIAEITPTGLRTENAEYEFDAIVFATGFDAMTGALTAIDIHATDGTTLKQKWEDGPRTYLGLMCAHFPNMFMVTGPGSPRC